MQERAPDEQKEESKKLKLIMERHKTLIPRIQVLQNMLGHHSSIHAVNNDLFGALFLPNSKIIQETLVKTEC